MVSKTKENWARRKLSRMGYILKKNRRRDVDSFNYGGYMIVDASKLIVSGTSNERDYTLTFDDVLTEIKKRSKNIFPLKIVRREISEQEQADMACPADHDWIITGIPALEGECYRTRDEASAAVSALK